MSELPPFLLQVENPYSNAPRHYCYNSGKHHGFNEGVLAGAQAAIQKVLDELDVTTNPYEILARVQRIKQQVEGKDE